MIKQSDKNCRVEPESHGIKCCVPTTSIGNENIELCREDR